MKPTIKSFDAMQSTLKKNIEVLEELKSYGDVLPKKCKDKATKPPV